MALFGWILYDPPAFLGKYQKRFVKEDEHELNEDLDGHGRIGGGRVLDVYEHGSKTGIRSGHCPGIAISAYGADTRHEFACATIDGHCIQRTNCAGKHIPGAA